MLCSPNFLLFKIILVSGREFLLLFLGLTVVLFLSVECVTEEGTEGTYCIFFFILASPDITFRATLYSQKTLYQLKYYCDIIIRNCRSNSLPNEPLKANQIQWTTIKFIKGCLGQHTACESLYLFNHSSLAVSVAEPSTSLFISLERNFKNCNFLLVTSSFGGVSLLNWMIYWYGETWTGDWKHKDMFSLLRELCLFLWLLLSPMNSEWSWLLVLRLKFQTCWKGDKRGGP